MLSACPGMRDCELKIDPQKTDLETVKRPVPNNGQTWCVDGAGVARRNSGRP
jgi:hypothetical protein